MRLSGSVPPRRTAAARRNRGLGVAAALKWDTTLTKCPTSCQFTGTESHPRGRKRGFEALPGRAKWDRIAILPREEREFETHYRGEYGSVDLHPEE